MMARPSLESENEVSMVRLCAASDLSESPLIRVTLREDLDICVSKAGGKFYAVADRCGHSNAPLSKGEVEGTVVTCPLHLAQFDLMTGAVVRPPNQATPRPEGAAVAAVASAAANGSAVAAPVQTAPVGGAVSGAAIRALIRTLPLKTFNVEVRGGELFIELP